MRKLVILILLLSNCCYFAQSVSVLKTEQIKIKDYKEVFYPKFSKDDTKIIFTSSNYLGLYIYDLSNNQTSVVSNEAGAGYNPLFTNDGEVLYRTFKIETGRKYHSLNLYNYNSLERKNIINHKRKLKLPNQIINNELLTVENSSVKMKKVSNDTEGLSESKKAVYVFDNNLILVTEDGQSNLNPLGKGIYVWETLCNNNQNILFTYENKGAFLCDLEGNIILNIENAHYPRLSPNGKYISYMIDKDNGHNYVASDIFVYSLEENKSYQITKTEALIEMYPEWSNDGRKLIFNTDSGDLFISELQFEN